MREADQGIYGMPLEDLTLNGDHVPSFLPSACKFVVDYASSVGVFRKCGQHLLLLELGKLFLYPDVVPPPSASVYDMAAFLKKWLRELPEPLISPSIFKEHFEPDNPDCVRIVLQNLSVTARKTFAYLCQVIQSVVDQASVNQMTLKNLSFCFFENITQNSKDIGRAFPFQFFFQNAQLLFDPEQMDFRLDAPIDPMSSVALDSADTPFVFNIQELQRAVQEADLATA
jgi:hypothetical protein